MSEGIFELVEGLLMFFCPFKFDVLLGKCHKQC
jgi:hypothetical protein